MLRTRLNGAIPEAMLKMSTRARCEDLVMMAFELEKSKGHEQYMGFIKCLRELSKVNRTLRVVLKNEGLYHE